LTTRLTETGEGAAKGGDTVLAARPPFWLRMSVLQGNVLQVAGVLVGIGLLYAAAHLDTMAALRVLLLLVGWFAIYVCSHAIAHWLAGRLVGIQFIGYGLRGTDHPQDYPRAVRRVVAYLPTFTSVCLRP
jgi:hypothetical protein